MKNPIIHDPLSYSSIFWAQCGLSKNGPIRAPAMFVIFLYDFSNLKFKHEIEGENNPLLRPIAKLTYFAPKTKMGPKLIF